MLSRRRPPRGTNWLFSPVVQEAMSTGKKKKKTMKDIHNNLCPQKPQEWIIERRRAHKHQRRREPELAHGHLPTPPQMSFNTVKNVLEPVATAYHAHRRATFHTRPAKLPTTPLPLTSATLHPSYLHFG